MVSCADSRSANTFRGGGGGGGGGGWPPKHNRTVGRKEELGGGGGRGRVCSLGYEAKISAASLRLVRSTIAVSRYIYIIVYLTFFTKLRLFLAHTSLHHT